MHEPITSIVKEADDSAAPFVLIYIGVVVVWLFAIIAWVYYFRGYA